VSELIKPRPELNRAHEPSHRAKRIKMRTDQDENDEIVRSERETNEAGSKIRTGAKRGGKSARRERISCRGNEEL